MSSTANSWAQRFNVADINIKVDQADLNLIKDDLRHINNGMPIAVVRSINRAVDGVRTDMVAIARKTYTVKATAARKNITVKKAAGTNMNAWTESKGEPIGLINFKVSPSTVQPKRTAPITVEIITGQPKKLLHAFVAVMPSGHKGVFWRKPLASGKRAKRLPIHELSGPRIEDLYARSENQAALQKGADDRLTAELARQADYLFNQRNGLL